MNQAKNLLKRILVPVHSNALPIINHRNRGGKNNGGDSAGFLPTPLPPIGFLKFIYSEKTKNFCEISTVYLF